MTNREKWQDLPGEVRTDVVKILFDASNALVEEAITRMRCGETQAARHAFEVAEAAELAAKVLRSPNGKFRENNAPRDK